MTATATLERQPELLPIAEAHELPDTDWSVLTEGDRPMSNLATLDAPTARPPAVQNDSHTLMAVIAHAAKQPGVDLATIRELYAFKREFEKDEARKAFHAAMAAFKKNPPSLVKDARVHYVKKDQSVVDYRHATLGHIVKQITAGLSHHDLSASWDTKRADGRIYVTCTITHALGHSESVTLDAPPDDSGGKNPIQAMGSTVRYLQRYTLECVTGLAAEDGSDDDGRGGSGDDDGQAEQRGTQRTVTRDEQRTPPPPATYAAAEFDKNLPTWRKAIESGRRTADQVIETVEAKAPLTDEQKARIRGTH